MNVPVELLEDTTILIPSRWLVGWLAALRSGEYAQATGKLCDVVRQPNGMLATTDGVPVKGYCCLGVLQMVIDGKVEMGEHGDALGLPTTAWLQAKGITFFGRLGRASVTSCASPLLTSLGLTADEANDGVDDGEESDQKRQSFAQIADAIELVAQGYDPEEVADVPARTP